jgi:outer membrane lipoprotein
MNKRFVKLIVTTSLALFIASCGGISRQVKSEAIPPVPFPTLVQNPDNYIGKTVILAGYVLETKNVEGRSEITVLQSPLSFGDAPKQRDLSQGRFVVSYNGFLDPQVYGKDREITIAGVVEGTVAGTVGEAPYSMLKLQAREIYLWPERVYYPYYYYPYYPYPFWHSHIFIVKTIKPRHGHGGFHGKPGGFHGRPGGGLGGSGVFHGGGGGHGR